MTFSLIDAIFPENVPDNLNDYGIVMPKETAFGLIAAQDAAGMRLHRVQPVPLVDGRYTVNAGILNDVGPGKLYSEIHLVDPAWISTVTILPWSEVLSLLPKPDPEEFNV